jgi:hypothetical protein
MASALPRKPWLFPFWTTSDIDQNRDVDIPAVSIFKTSQIFPGTWSSYLQFFIIYFALLSLGVTRNSRNDHTYFRRKTQQAVVQISWEKREWKGLGERRPPGTTDDRHPYKISFNFTIHNVVKWFLQGNFGVSRWPNLYWILMPHQKYMTCHV